MVLLALIVLAAAIRAVAALPNGPASLPLWFSQIYSSNQSEFREACDGIRPFGGRHDTTTGQPMEGGTSSSMKVQWYRRNR
jgi:hypothetical protein